MCHPEQKNIVEHWLADLSCGVIWPKTCSARQTREDWHHLSVAHPNLFHRHSNVTSYLSGAGAAAPSVKTFSSPHHHHYQCVVCLDNFLTACFALAACLSVAAGLYIHTQLQLYTAVVANFGGRRPMLLWLSSSGSDPMGVENNGTL